MEKILTELAKLIKDAEASGGGVPRIYRKFQVEIVKSDDEKRVIEAVVSTEDIDRDGDTIRADGWKVKEFKKNPVIPWSHNYSLPPVARAGRVWVKDKQLMARIEFPGPDTVGEGSFEDKIYKMYRDGYLNTFSVGFEPLKWEYVERTVNSQKRTGIDFLSQNLWEISACTIPSNPNAAMVRAKDAGILTNEDIEILEKWQKAPGAEEPRKWSGSAMVFSDLVKQIEENGEIGTASGDMINTGDQIDDPPENEENEVTLDLVMQNISSAMGEFTQAVKDIKSTVEDLKTILKIQTPEPAGPAQDAEPDNGGTPPQDKDEEEDTALTAALSEVGKSHEPVEELKPGDLERILSTVVENMMPQIRETTRSAVNSQLGVVDPTGLTFKPKTNGG